MSRSSPSWSDSLLAATSPRLLLAVVMVIGLMRLANGGVVPRPVSMTPLGVRLLLPRQIDYQIATNLAACHLLHDAVRRFDSHLHQATDVRKTWSGKTDVVNGSLAKVIIATEMPTLCDERVEPYFPQAGQSESYELMVLPSGTMMLTSTDVWGILHGLETAAQLVDLDDSGQRTIECVLVKDKPRYAHRGFLIDTSRHYLSVDVITTLIDAMAMVKMNVLHWHIVDDQAFPFVSTKFPNLSKKGAYDPAIKVYTRSDVMKILHQARIRGIRLMPEFDTPGHTLSWGKSQKGLLTTCYDKNGNPDGTFGPINPAEQKNYQFLQEFFQEIVDCFPENYIHLGGDEVDFQCWQSNAEVVNYTKELGFPNDFKKLEAHYITRLADIVEAMQKPNRTQSPVPIFWQEVFDNGVRMNKNAVQHVWRIDKWEEHVANMTAAGYRVLFSSCWYLNYINYASDWTQFYNCDPSSFNGTDAQKALLIGGEAAMWGEYVDDTNLISRSWPRGAAVAERLWSTGDLHVYEFTPRIAQLRCRMLRRGIQAEPVNGPDDCY